MCIVSTSIPREAPRPRTVGPHPVGAVASFLSDPSPYSLYFPSVINFLSKHNVDYIALLLKGPWLAVRTIPPHVCPLRPLRPTPASIALFPSDTSPPFSTPIHRAPATLLSFPLLKHTLLLGLCLGLESLILLFIQPFLRVRVQTPATQKGLRRPLCLPKPQL